MINEAEAVSRSQLSIAHDLFHGLASISSTVASAKRIVDGGPARIEDEDWSDLQEHLLIVSEEVEAQQYQAVSRIAVCWPAVALGILRPSFAGASPARVLEALLPRYQERAAARLVTFAIDTESLTEFPPIQTEIHTLRRMFHNILGNALKYSYRGTREKARFLRIWAKRHEAHGSRWAICFENFGIGLSREECGAVFDAGVRGQMAIKENVLGTGLGLADVRLCMEQFGGEATITSELQEGGAYLTTLTLVFAVPSRFTGALKQLWDRREDDG
jgi:signal transduction histidine kinase